MVAEYNTSGTVLRRYIYGAGLDEVLCWYEGSGTGDKRWLTTDHLGSVTAITNSSGAAIAINTYDEYGLPESGNTGRFQYTGQMWIEGPHGRCRADGLVPCPDDSQDHLDRELQGPRL
ncbi:hypothetical protein [Aquisalinus flavus]|uniref:hypothetical protein n=1 Tax=Aquisalinus flavus TaxID=1526572 RepID=UPI00165F2EB6|nr:hypothetical protein [Aquisalinus flavus]MBD0428019.1 hypothetical protein [Aquisalinus flavus]